MIGDDVLSDPAPALVQASAQAPAPARLQSGPPEFYTWDAARFGLHRTRVPSPASHFDAASTLVVQYRTGNGIGGHVILPYRV